MAENFESELLEPHSRDCPLDPMLPTPLTDTKLSQKGLVQEVGGPSSMCLSCSIVAPRSQDKTKCCQEQFHLEVGDRWFSLRAEELCDESSDAGDSKYGVVEFNSTLEYVREPSCFVLPVTAFYRCTEGPLGRKRRSLPSITDETVVKLDRTICQIVIML